MAQVSASSPTASDLLFTPLKVGEITIQHRVVMAPLTRYRADDAHVPTDMLTEYYSQRASVPGTLLVTEGTFIAQRAGGFENVPGIWSEAQIAGWKKVTDAVHARGSFIFLQLWALGRSAKPAVLAKEAEEAGLPVDAIPYVSASAVAPDKYHGHNIFPRPLSVDEIDEYVDLYAQAAKNAVHGAGFDGVEIHGANGYIIDQFLQDVTNQRTDAYGGSIEARAHFPLRIVDAVASAVGPGRTGLRISPWSVFQGMRMTDPISNFSHFIREVRTRHPRLAYLHVVEGVEPTDSNDFARAIWREGADETSAFLSASGYERASALKGAQETGDVIVFGRWFISNPDLPRRLKEDIPLTPFDYSTFYTKKSSKGYTDYPFAVETAEALKVVA